jgi:hypothetical protein
MKMRQIFLLIVLYLGVTQVGFSQYQTFSRLSNGTNAITVPNGEIWQVVNWYGAGDWNFAYFSYDMGGGDLTFSGTSSSFYSLEAPGGGNHIGLIIQGPATLRAREKLSITSLPYLMVVKKISSTSSASALSATAVVIPTSSSGDVDVKMEQSADNVTWTECLPGTYNSSTVKRFFRLRAVEK